MLHLNFRIYRKIVLKMLKFEKILKVRITLKVNVSSFHLNKLVRSRFCWVPALKIFAFTGSNFCKVLLIQCPRFGVSVSLLVCATENSAINSFFTLAGLFENTQSPCFSKRVNWTISEQKHPQMSEFVKPHLWQLCYEIAICCYNSFSSRQHTTLLAVIILF